MGYLFPLLRYFQSCDWQTNIYDYALKMKLALLSPAAALIAVLGTSSTVAQTCPDYTTYSQVILVF